MTFEQLYKTVLRRALKEDKSPLPPYDPYHLDCLLHPEKYPPIIHAVPCDGNQACEDTKASPDNSQEQKPQAKAQAMPQEENCNQACQRSCLFDAIVMGPNNKLTIDIDKCTGCASCIEACKSGKLTASRDILPALYAIKDSDRLSYALVAPAFLGQFTDAVTPGRLRSAFKALGFSGMVEVALFADILTLKEALEFDQNIKNLDDFQLTSCCCPVWISMIRKIYKELMPHVPGSVSPMIASGRVIKMLHPDAVTIFIGPCLAKKSEAKDPELAGAIDYVLTFQEMADIFEAAGIDPKTQPEIEKDHSSRGGRIYARTGGVSEAVQSAVNDLNPQRSISIKTRQADGVPACRAMIEEIRSGKLSGNFYEGMGCVGGCVGGPKAILDKDLGREYVEAYGNSATSDTPQRNPYVMELLHRIGIDNVHELLEDDTIFTQHF